MPPIHWGCCLRQIYFLYKPGNFFSQLEPSSIIPSSHSLHCDWDRLLLPSRFHCLLATSTTHSSECCLWQRSLSSSPSALTQTLKESRNEHLHTFFVYLHCYFLYCTTTNKTRRNFQPTGSDSELQWECQRWRWWPG